MNGTIKHYDNKRGFGFIHVPGESDRFFHITQFNNPEPPNVGDTVTFDAEIGKDGRTIATNVEIVARKPPAPRGAYFGNPTYRSEPDDTPVAQTLTGAGILGGIGFLIGGPVGGIIGAGLGGALAENKKQVEVTSPCIKCGGTGSTTATIDGWTGFQCKRCHHFWKVRNPK